MKSILLTTLLFTFNLTAQASFIQENCSDSEGATLVSNGHVKTEVSITKRTFSEGTTTNKKIIISSENYDIDYGKEILLEQEIHDACQNDELTAYATYTKIYTKKITINRIDRSLFSPDIVGVNSARTTLERHLICRKFHSHFKECH